MDYIKIIETDYNGEPKSVALCAPKLTFSGGPANTIQLSIEQDGQDAYIDLWPTEVTLLRDKLNEWLEEKGIIDQSICAGKWKQLGLKVEKIYELSNSDESLKEEENSLLEIGEVSAKAFGFLK